MQAGLYNASLYLVIVPIKLLPSAVPDFRPRHWLQSEIGFHKVDTQITILVASFGTTDDELR